MNIRRAAFRPGDRVQLTDQKGRRRTVVLRAGGEFHTHQGTLAHDDLIGTPEGSVVTSSAGVPYLALRPLLADFVLSMPRGAAVVYPKDASAIIGMADIFPGARVLEAGAGSGGLTCWLLRATGPDGLVHSFERRPEFARIAETNVDRFFGDRPPWWRLSVGDVSEAPATLDPAEADRVVLDMLAPWEVLKPVSDVLVPGGVFSCYVATTTQLSRLVEEIRTLGGFSEPEASELLQREWHVEGLAVRPEHRMVGHTGFLVMARRLAPGVNAPPRRRRPAKGATPTPD